MPTPTTVGDLSIEEFKRLVHQIVLDTLRELIADPDKGLPCRRIWPRRFNKRYTLSKKDKRPFTPRKTLPKIWV